MKGLGIAVLLVLVGIENAMTQDKVSKEELVKTIAASINQQNIDELKPHLSDDFQISGRVPPISIKILEQLVSQLNEQVEEYYWKNTESNSDSTQTHFFHFSYSGLGEREVSFSVNEQGKITELELVKMTVKTLEEPSKVMKPAKKVIEIPFQVKENLMLVEATINGEKKNFIFDSGSPRLILNQGHYGEPGSSEETKYSSLEGVHGNINSLDILTLSELNFYGIKMNDQKVLAADLSHLEVILEIPIAGLIGYEVFEGYDLLFNYSTQTLRFIQPDQTQTFVTAMSAQLSMSSIPFELRQHIPLFEASVSGQTMTFGLDSGASTNLLSEDRYEELSGSLSSIRETDLTGADGRKEIVMKGTLDKLTIAEVDFDTTPTAFKDVSNLKQAYGKELDGLAGYEILSRQVTMVSYSQHKIYLFR
ncbi:pepsin/retropepsin-like aspartic protease family protein [Gracilimonas tropica]|uniref:pepsin/retropepsin-like aspartic protease family protein n=1 Tax=Gracilimonas tropica TaxID=454600 RepID=UPI0014614A19|nr:pepsin/retropepsin-like aspartic protease family protein [Gracilimonas tropica]